MAVNIIIINVILLLIGVVLTAIGFFMFYNYRKLSKIIFAAVIFAIGILLFFLGIGLISFNIWFLR